MKTTVGVLFYRLSGVLMHVIKVVAQPHGTHPLVKSGSLKRGVYDVRKRGTFGLIWLTDFGELVWNTCKEVNPNAKIRLSKSGFDEMNWTVSFRMEGFKIKLTSKKYKGFLGYPRNCYLELKIGAENPQDLQKFVQTIAENYAYIPWEINNWQKMEKKTGLDQKMITEQWIQAGGKDISEYEEKASVGILAKVTGFFKAVVSKIPFISKLKRGAKSKNEEEIVLVDGDGIERTFELHGTLEMKGSEYAILLPSGGNKNEFNILEIVKSKGNVSYEGIDDEVLFRELSAHAEQYVSNS